MPFVAGGELDDGGLRKCGVGDDVPGLRVVRVEGDVGVPGLPVLVAGGCAEEVIGVQRWVRPDGHVGAVVVQEMPGCAAARSDAFWPRR
jgi:hypothetical protein